MTTSGVPSSSSMGRLSTRRLRRREGHELRRLEQLPRFTPGEANLLGGKVRYVDSSSLVSAYRAIFNSSIYSFRSDRPDPFIIDGGANIGLATLFWTRAFPSPRIHAYEPDPGCFEALNINVARFGLRDVTLHQAALWTTTGSLNFAAQGADAGRLSETGNTRVASIRLAETLDHPIDLLKLDIEGAEVDVLNDSAHKLDNVQRLFVEYHGFRNQDQRLGELLELLRAAGLRYWLHGEYAPPQPFVETSVDHDMDLRVNVFAVRQEG